MMRLFFVTFLLLFPVVSFAGTISLYESFPVAGNTVTYPYRAVPYLLLTASTSVPSECNYGAGSYTVNNSTELFNLLNNNSLDYICSGSFLVATVTYTAPFVYPLNVTLSQSAFSYESASLPDVAYMSPEAFISYYVSAPPDSVTLLSLSSQITLLDSKVANMDPLTITQSISFLLGSFTALAFVMASHMRF